MQSPTGPVPAHHRWLMILASRMVSPDRRGEWLRYWVGGLDHWWAFMADRGEPRPLAVAKLREYTRTALRHAWRERFPDDTLHSRVSKTARMPAFLFAVLLTSLIILGAGSDMFRGTRSVFSPLPYRDPDRLFTVSQHISGFGQLNGVPPATIMMWKSCPMPEIAGLAAFNVRKVGFGREGAPDVSLSMMQVSPEFFDVLGVTADTGQTPRLADLHGPRPVILSHRLWRTTFGSDLAVLKRLVTLDGQPAIVVGVMPRSFWVVAPNIDLWTTLPASAMPMYPRGDWRRRFVGVILRTSPGTTDEKAQAALQKVAQGNRMPWSGARARLQSLNDFSSPSLYVSGAGFTVTSLLLLLAAVVPRGRFSLRAMAGVPFSKASRYWWFFFGKTTLLLGILILIWFESTQGLRDPVSGLLSSWVFLLACVAVAVFSLADQRRRCPVCLHRLSMPVSMGTYSRPLLDPASTELLCDQGHGMLTVPDTESSTSGPERWTALDESWRELFTR